jgi:Holliday junction DNA helicase RuvA
LASLSAQEFKNALANEDVARLRQIPGVGAKGAQRLVLELKDRVGVATGDRVRATGWQDQVEQGLIGLGWTSKEAAKAVLAVQDSGVSDEDVATLLKRALQILAN